MAFPPTVQPLGAYGEATVYEEAELPEDELRELLNAVRSGKAENTRRAYRSGWRRFEAWCRERHRRFLPANPTTVAAFLATARTLRGGTPSTATVESWRAAIHFVHRARGLPSPARDPGVQEVMDGVRRARGTRQVGKDPLLLEDLQQLVASTGDPAFSSRSRAVRDRAILTLGFAGAFRRSEIVGIEVRHVLTPGRGVLGVFLPSSKGDPEKQGTLATFSPRTAPHEAVCAIQALRSWVDVLVTQGAALGPAAPVFRAVDSGGRVGPKALRPAAVAAVVKAAARRAGFSPEAVQRFAGHSLRSGAATQAAMNGGDLLDVCRLTRHKSLEMARRYIREVEAWTRPTSDVLFR